MACWKDLYRMLTDPQMTPEQIVTSLGVKPSRLRRMLASKRLAAALAAAEVIAEERAAHVASAARASAVENLRALTDSDRAETARRSCLDVMELSRQLRPPGSMVLSHFYQPRGKRPRGYWRGTAAEVR